MRVEYISVAEYVEEVLFLRNVFRCMLPRGVGLSATALEDAQGAIQLPNNLLCSSRPKHINVRHHISALIQD